MDVLGAAGFLFNAQAFEQVVHPREAEVKAVLLLHQVTGLLQTLDLVLFQFLAQGLHLLLAEAGLVPLIRIRQQGARAALAVQLPQPLTLSGPQPNAFARLSLGAALAAFQQPNETDPQAGHPFGLLAFTSKQFFFAFPDLLIIIQYYHTPHTHNSSTTTPLISFLFCDLPK